MASFHSMPWDLCAKPDLIAEKPVVPMGRQRERNRQMRHGIRSLGLMCALGGLVAVSTCTSPAFAQLRGEKNASILNYLGRYHGVGYSDGYHTCPDKAKCGNLGISQAQLYDSPSSIGSTNFRPLLGVQDRWIGMQANAVGVQTYTTPSTIVHPNAVKYPPSHANQYSREYFSPYAVPTPATPVHPFVPEAVPSIPQSPRSLIPGQFSPSDSNPRMLNPSGGVPSLPSVSPNTNPSGDSQLPVKTGPVSLPAEFYNHYSNVPAVGNGYSQTIYSQSQMTPQTVRPQMNIGQPAGRSEGHSILRQSSLAPSSY